ncbi:cupredoxin domain-containing protein [Candidatus Woesearchaeota archaeon]|nr:cupredoxin domain-containing protein [Candidatus Woesearchaeota archaeon]
MKKYFIAFFILSVLFIAACSNTTQNTQKKDKIGPPPLPPTGETKVFNIEAKRWQYTPDTITVNEGDSVILKMHSIDVTHGFGLAGYNINKVINPGETVTVEFVADQKGTFNFVCTVPCGEGHSNMKGKVVVN